MSNGVEAGTSPLLPENSSGPPPAQSSQIGGNVASGQGKTQISRDHVKSSTTTATPLQQNINNDQLNRSVLGHASKGMAGNGVSGAKSGRQRTVRSQNQMEVLEIKPPYPRQFLPREFQNAQPKAFAPADWQSAPVKAGPSPKRAATKWTLGGSLAGLLGGGVAGGLLGGGVGALVGTVVCPGVGTAAGAVLGAKIGATMWGSAGTLIGGAVGGRHGYQRAKEDWEVAARSAPLPKGPALKRVDANSKFDLDTAAGIAVDGLGQEYPAFQTELRPLITNLLEQQAVARVRLGFAYDHHAAVSDVDKFTKHFRRSHRELRQVHGQVVKNREKDRLLKKWQRASLEAAKGLSQAIEEEQPAIVVAKKACALSLAIRRYAIVKRKSRSKAAVFNAQDYQPTCRAALEQIVAQHLRSLDASSRSKVHAQLTSRGNPGWALLNIEDPSQTYPDVWACLAEISHQLSNRNGASGRPGQRDVGNSTINWHLWNAKVALKACKPELEIDEAVQDHFLRQSHSRPATSHHALIQSENDAHGVNSDDHVRVRNDSISSIEHNASQQVPAESNSSAAQQMRNEMNAMYEQIRTQQNTSPNEIKKRRDTIASEIGTQAGEIASSGNGE